MRTTLAIRDDLLARAKVLAASQHRTIGSVVEEALGSYLDGPRPDLAWTPLPDYADRGGLIPGVDLRDKDLMAGLLIQSPNDAVL